MKESIVIGRIVKPQGIRGEVKIVPITDNISRFKSIKTIIIESTGKIFNVLTSRADKDSVYLGLESILDRNQAELLRGEYICIERNQAPKLDEGRHYIIDLIGLNIMCDGKKIGKLREILQYGAADVYVVDTDNGEILFPAAEGVITNTDLENKTITVNSKRFLEVTEYDED